VTERKLFVTANYFNQ